MQRTLSESLYSKPATCDNVKKIKMAGKEGENKKKAMMCGSPHTNRREHIFNKKLIKKSLY